MGLELANGNLYKALKIWSKMFYRITKSFTPFFIAFALISLLGWIYNSIYTRFGVEKVIISGVVMMTYYLNKILTEVKKKNGN